MEHLSLGNPGLVSGGEGRGHFINTTIKEGCHGNALHQFLEVQETKPKRETFKSINTDPALLAAYRQGELEGIALNKNQTEKRKLPFGNVMGHMTIMGINDPLGHKRKEDENKPQH